jgi:predicted kinase
MGKSTFVKTFIRNQTIKTFSTDDVSLMLTKDPNVYHKGSSEINLNRLKGFMKTGQSFIYDTTGTQEENVRDIHNMAKFNGYSTIFIHVIGPLDTAIRQNQERDRQVPEDYIKLAYERQFGNMSKYSNELHPNSYYIVQNINGKYKFSKYESGKVLKRKASLYESAKEELDGEMIHYIFDDIIDDFGGDNVIFYDFFNKVTYGNDPNKLKNLAISNDIYNSRGFRFKVVVDMKGSGYDKFLNLVNMFNSCLKRLNDLGWNLFSMDVDCVSSGYSNNDFRRVTFVLSRPEEEIKDRSFDAKEMTELIKRTFDENGLSVTDMDFYENDESDNECRVDFASNEYRGQMPRDLEDRLSDIEKLIGASNTNVVRDNEVIYTWNEWDPSHYKS